MHINLFLFWYFDLRYLTYRTQRLRLTASWTYFIIGDVISHLSSRRREGFLTDETFIWTHSSVTSVGVQSKNSPKPNRTEQNPAKIKHAAKVYCSCSTSLSAFPFLPPFVPPLCSFFQSAHHFSPLWSFIWTKIKRRLKCKFIHLRNEVGLFFPGETCRWELYLNTCSSGGKA